MTARGISEVVLVVDDVPACTAFYRDVVGLPLESEPDDRWAWFTIRDEPHACQRLALARGPLLYEEHSPHPPDQRWGPVHFALQVNRADINDTLARAGDAGHTIHGPKYFDWMRAESWYVYDPAGNLVEFWVPDEPG